MLQSELLHHMLHENFRNLLRSACWLSVKAALRAGQTERNGAVYLCLYARIPVRRCSVLGTPHWM